MFWKNQREEDQPEYMGNIWGWKFSLYSGILIVLVFILTIPQQCHYWKTGSQGIPTDQVEQ